MKLLNLMLMLVALAIAAAAPAAEPEAKVDYEGNLAKVPAADPAATDAPKLIKAMESKHPRLLFTSEEIATLKKQAETDEILKKTAAEVVALGKRFKLQKEAKPGIVTNDTPALAQAFGNYTQLAWAYALDKNPTAKQGIIDILTMMLDQPYWADGAELDSNMGAANNMLMVAILFDTIHDDLDPDFRAKMAKKILTHARRMHYLGYKQLSLMKIKYWQQDPQPNHRWHRGAGMAASLLAIADEPGVDGSYLLQEFKKEMDFLIKWYPADGDCHEGAGYQAFGFNYLIMAARMMDRNLGTTYQRAPGFSNAWAQQIYYKAPGRSSYMSFGDESNTDRKFGHLDAAFFACPAISRDKNAQAALLADMQARSGGKYPWSMLAFYDPTVGLGDAKALPPNRLFADLGAASMRDSWEPNGVLFTFKCGPYGGYRLNEYRHEVKGNDGKPHYVNIAHDDPDANSFALGFDGELIFHPGNYSQVKMTDTNNTITVDGKGQRGEADQYTQPVPDVDMRTLSYLTGWKAGEKNRVIIEGEGGAAYPDLERYRRMAIWMPGEYILLLDDIKAKGQHRITWRGMVEKGQFDKPEDGRCHAYVKSGKRVDFQMLANQDFKGSIDFIMLSGRWNQLLMQQFQFSADAPAVKYACLMDPWKKKVSLTLKEDAGLATLTVKGDGIDDTWTWKAAADANTPSAITGKRAGAELITLTGKDTAPRGGL